MKKLIAALSLIAFFATTTIAQEKTTKDTKAKKECCKKDAKAKDAKCDKDKKACCKKDAKK